MKKIIKNTIIVLSILIIVILVIILAIRKDKNTDNEFYTKEGNTKPKERYECNEFQFEDVNTEDLLQIYLNNYKYKSYLLPEEAYNLLNKEYREKKFGSLEEYKKYVQANLESIFNANIQKYQTENKEGYIQYIGIDQNGNYYIFKETAIMQYELILDTYTVDLPEFTERYNNATEQQKVALNIDKFMQAINLKDYNYAYNCLAQSFKDNYFKTQEEFEKYIKENFYIGNKITYNKFENTSNIYTYLVTITNTVTNEQKQKTFIVKLNEGNSFEMSFNV